MAKLLQCKLYKNCQKVIGIMFFFYQRLPHNIIMQLNNLLLEKLINLSDSALSFRRVWWKITYFSCIVHSMDILIMLLITGAQQLHG